MDCRDFDELISLDLDGRLDPKAREEIENHLSGCAECRSEAFAARKAERLLAALPRHRASAGFGEALARRIEAAPPAARMPWALFPGMGRLASVAAGIAIGVALAGSFHVALNGLQKKTSAGENAAPGRETPEESGLVRLAGDSLGRNLHALETFNSDAHLFPGEEPDVARDVLANEVSALDIPGRISEIRRYGDVYRKRDRNGWDVMSEILKCTSEIVDSVGSAPAAGMEDEAVMGGIKIRAGESLRRIEAARRIFGPDFARSPVVFVESGGADVPSQPRDSNPVRLYVSGINLWTDGKAAPAIDVFREIEKAHPGTAMARRARDMTIWILADMGRVRRDLRSVHDIDQLLGDGVVISQLTMNKIESLLTSIEESGMPAENNLKIRISAGFNKQQLHVFPSTPAQALKSVGTVSGVEVNGRRIQIREGGAAAILDAIRKLPRPWRVLSCNASLDSDGRGKRVSIVLVLPKGASCTYSPDLAAALESLEKEYPGSFAPACLARIMVEGKGE